jgi:hypothetical protein
MVLGTAIAIDIGGSGLPPVRQFTGSEQSFERPGHLASIDLSVSFDNVAEDISACPGGNFTVGLDHLRLPPARRAAVYVRSLTSGASAGAQAADAVSVAE